MNQDESLKILAMAEKYLSPETLFMRVLSTNEEKHIYIQELLSGTFKLVLATGRVVDDEW